MIVKICGLASEEAVRAAVEAGADAVGFVLAPSPRQVTLQHARELLEHVPAHLERVAVFARAEREDLEAACFAGFDAVQAEAGSPLDDLPCGAFALPVVRDGEDLEERLGAVLVPHDWSEGSLRGAIVVDGPRGGGQGVAVDPARARAASRTRPLVLAGGLTPENVAERIAAVAPVAVDTSSGVEAARGRKDPARIHAFVSRARRAFEELRA